MHNSIIVFYNVIIFYLENATLNLLRLTEGSNEHVQEIIDLGVVPRLVHFLAHGKDSIVLRALKMLTNIVKVNGAHTETILNAGAAPKLIKLLSRRDVSVVYHTLDAVVNILSSDGDKVDSVLSSGTFPVLINLLNHDDVLIVGHALKAIGSIVSVSGAKAYMALKANICPLLMKLLRPAEFNVYIREYAARTVRNLLRHKNSRGDTVVKSRLLPALAHLLNNISDKQLVYGIHCGTYKNIVGNNQLNFKTNYERLMNVLFIFIHRARLLGSLFFHRRTEQTNPVAVGSWCFTASGFFAGK